MSVPFPACALAFLLIPLTAGATPGGGVVLLVPDGADLAVVRAARATTTPAPLLVGAGRTIALDGGLSAAADFSASDVVPEAATLVLLPGPASPVLDALVNQARVFVLLFKMSGNKDCESADRAWKSYQELVNMPSVGSARNTFLKEYKAFDEEKKSACSAPAPAVKPEDKPK